MSYVPPHLRPGYKPRPAAAAAAPARRGVKFINNVKELNTPVAPNNGTRHAPRRNATPARRTLKVSKAVASPNKTPKARPTHLLRKLPKTFRAMLVERVGKHAMGKLKPKSRGKSRSKKLGSHKPSKKAKKHGKKH